MRKFRKYIALSTMLFLLFSCRDFDGDLEEIEEGRSAQITLSLMSGSSATRSVLSDEQETVIDNLHILIFDSGGDIVNNSYYQSDDFDQSGGVVELIINSYTGAGREIVVVANSSQLSDDLVDSLNAVATKEQLEAIVVEAESFNDIPEQLTMSGSTTMDITTSSSDAVIYLEYLSAKVTLNIYSGLRRGDRLELFGWGVRDVAAKSYLVEQDQDAVDIDSSGDWFSTTTTNSFDDDSGDYELSRGDSRSCSFYLLENRRGGRVYNSSSPANGGSIDDQDDQNKEHYAPSRATYITISGRITDRDESSDITLSIYLGEDNHSDYNVYRGHHYSVDVTINGIDDIDIDSNIEYAVQSFDVETSQSMVMDSHPDMRIIHILATLGAATVEIVDSDGRSYSDYGFDATWLKISPLDILRPQIKQSGEDGYWQQDAIAEGGYARAKYIPHRSIREALSREGVSGWNTISIEDDDDELSYDDATYRMCYKITDIPFSSVEATELKEIFIYADDYDAPQSSSRTAQIKISYRGEGSVVDYDQLIDISQIGYLSYYESGSDLSEDGLTLLNEDGTLPSTRILKRFVVERIEESDVMIYPDVEAEGTMVWGFYNYRLYDKNDSKRNGYITSLNSVYNSIVRSDNQITSIGTQRSLYPRDSRYAFSSFSGNNSGSPYYYPEWGSSAYHPIYNSSAANYVNSKNRDLNGDGELGLDEIFWYTPSLQQQSLMWIFFEGFDAGYSSQSYHNATENSSTDNCYINFSSGECYYDYKTTLMRVRAVKDLE